MGVAILISGSADFRAKKVTSGKEGHYKVIKGSVLQEELMTLNVNLKVKYQNM